MQTSFTKLPLSASVNGKQIIISTTDSSSATPIHTAVAGETDWDEIWIYAYNAANLVWWVFNSNTISFYEGQTSKGGPTAWNNYGGDLNYMGRTSYGGYWNGYISEICIWDSALSQAQVTILYNGYFKEKYVGVFS